MSLPSHVAHTSYALRFVMCAWGDKPRDHREAADRETPPTGSPPTDRDATGTPEAWAYSHRMQGRGGGGARCHKSIHGDIWAARDIWAEPPRGTCGRSDCVWTEPTPGAAKGRVTACGQHRHAAPAAMAPCHSHLAGAAATRKIRLIPAPPRPQPQPGPGRDSPLVGGAHFVYFIFFKSCLSFLSEMWQHLAIVPLDGFVRP